VGFCLFAFVVLVFEEMAKRSEIKQQISGNIQVAITQSTSKIM
jgi:hypothetical protein